MTAVLLSCHAHPSPSLKAWNRRPTRPPSSPLAHPKPLLARPFGVSGKAGSENRLKNHSFPHSVQRATPWNPPRQPDCSRHLYSHSSLCSSSLLLGISLVIGFFLLSILSSLFNNSFFRCSWDDTFSTNPFWLCSRLSLRRSAHSRTNHSETNSLPAQITNHSETNSLPAQITNHSETDSLPATRPILPTVLSELLFQRPQNQGLPRLRDFVIAVFSHGYDYSYCPLLYRPPPASWSRALLTFLGLLSS